ncbi:MAG TPA: porin [Caulobacterales bacterium]|nr:porin [Caulobacterales bacterium]
MKTKEFIGTAALAALATAGLGAVTPAHADVTTAWNGAPETREEDRRFHVSGRFMYDIAATDSDNATIPGGAFTSGIRSYARRAFIGVDGRLTTHWRYNAKFDFTIGGSVNVDDMYLEYAEDWGSIFIGNSNAVSPMEDRDSSLNIPFNERSFLISAGGFGKRPGVAFLTNGGNWSWGVAVQSNDSLSTADDARTGNEPAFVISRFTYAPIFSQTPEGTTLVGFGLTARARDDGSNHASLSYNPGQLSTKLSNGGTGVNTGVTGFGQDTYLGGEFVFQYHSFGAEAEYGHFDVQDGVASGASADGYYVDLFWSPTGESRRYNAADGSFGAVAPRRTLGSDGGIGHVMLSLRYEDFDATDTKFSGAGIQQENEQKAFTIGATWVPVGHVKFQLNYSQNDIDYVGATPDNTITATTLRTQFDW